jgi:phosphatidate cytidylyltransferase
MLKHRVISGVSMGAVLILGILFIPSVFLVIVLAVISGWAQKEFYVLMEKCGVPVFRGVGLACGTALILLTYLALMGSARVPDVSSVASVILMLSIVAVMVRAFSPKVTDKRMESIACTLLGIAYVPFFLCFLLKLAVPHSGLGLWKCMGGTGQMSVFFLVLVVKTADVGAYFVGTRFGKNKLAPHISPGKTWEGLAGGVGAAALGSLLFWMLSGGKIGGMHLSMADLMVMGVVVSMCGVFGDLFESLVKRSAGEKDSGDTIPGMGGLLDVLDSLLFGAPFMYLYMAAFL